MELLFGVGVVGFALILDFEWKFQCQYYQHLLYARALRLPIFKMGDVTLTHTLV